MNSVIYMGKNLKNEHKSKNPLYDFWKTNLNYYKMIQDDSHKQHTQLLKTELTSFVNNGDVLDVACGACEIKRFLGKKVEYYGIDVSDTGLKEGKKAFKNVTLFKGDVENLPFNGNFFENVLCLYSLEHFIEPKKVVLEMIRVLKKDGLLVMAAPSHDNVFNIPESLKMQLTTRSRKYRYYIHRIKKYFDRDYNPQIITEPDVLKYPYHSDNDLTHVVTIRETLKILKKSNMKVVFLKTEKRWYNKLFMKYWNMPLFVVARKK